MPYVSSSDALYARILKLAWGLSGDKALDQLQKHVGKHNTFIRYVSKRFVGPNPKYSGSNPSGVFGVPLVADYLPTSENLKKLQGENNYTAGIMQQAPYLYVFSVASYDDLLLTEFYGEDDFNADCRKALRLRLPHPEIPKHRRIFPVNVGDLLDLVYRAAGGKKEERDTDVAPQALRAVYEKLGYSGILDTNRSLNEDTPEQLIVFRKSDVKPILKMRNPLAKES